MTNAAYGISGFLDVFTCDFSRLIEVSLCFLISLSLYTMKSINDMLLLENIESGSDKYGLTDVSNAAFERQGFCFKEKYYLYSLLFDTSISRPNTIELFNQLDLSTHYILMRCDQTLAGLEKQKTSNASLDLEKWRGIILTTENIESQIKSWKEIIVHYDPDTMHKVLLSVKAELTADGTQYYHMSVEGLWSRASFCYGEKVVITNFVHGCYYPNKKSYDHIDFSVN